MSDAAQVGRHRTALFVQEWIERGLRCGSVTVAEWRAWETGARRCYETAGCLWPGVVVRVPSPVVGAFAAPVAQRLITDLRRANLLTGKMISNPAAFVASNDTDIAAAVEAATGGVLEQSVAASIACAVRSAIAGATQQVHDAESPDFRAAVMSLQMGAADREIAASLSQWRSASAAARAAVGQPVRAAVDDVIGRAINDSVRSCINAAVAATSSSHATRPCLWPWMERRAGRWRSSELAAVAFLRDEVKLPVGERVWKLSAAVQSAESAGYWWPFADFVMVSDLPIELHIESGPEGPRLHRDRGPAALWSDGWAIHAVHGRRLLGRGHP
ncbi:DUF6745 domain-containing protein [Mycolicibacterium sp. CBMA 226]|uniref:DUF6745 domain-containing protein n=1 Tax=Mycolicibacterium sp. CBMA 226 TaxID=2606611 RepID=UPI0012DEE7B4|nr:hypothetical protein [Mycolicibacterium sp. CBMA 226]MUL78927.1 hypothetical protein [Mycolicibacterium sp. CBMA 226]